jgi:hypothetical protein
MLGLKSSNKFEKTFSLNLQILPVTMKMTNPDVIANIELDDVSSASLLYAWPSQITGGEYQVGSIITALEKESGDEWNAEVMAINEEGFVELKVDWESWNNSSLVEVLGENDLEEIEVWSDLDKTIPAFAARQMLANIEELEAIL